MTIRLHLFLFLTRFFFFFNHTSHGRASVLFWELPVYNLYLIINDPNMDDWAWLCAPLKWNVGGEIKTSAATSPVDLKDFLQVAPNHANHPYLEHICRQEVPINETEAIPWLFRWKTTHQWMIQIQKYSFKKYIIKQTNSNCTLQSIVWPQIEA